MAVTIQPMALVGPEEIPVALVDFGENTSRLDLDLDLYLSSGYSCEPYISYHGLLLLKGGRVACWVGLPPNLGDENLGESREDLACSKK